MTNVVDEALDAAARQDWERLTTLLHPYVHWNVGPVRLRGRRNVLAHLAGTAAPDAPADVELRDGQIYRWTR
jgi:hypothetical protein